MKGYNSVLEKIITILSKVMSKNGYIAGRYTDLYLQRSIKIYSHPQNDNFKEDYEKTTTRMLKENAIIPEETTDPIARWSLVPGVPTNEYVGPLLPDDAKAHVYVFTLNAIDVENLSSLTDESMVTS